MFRFLYFDLILYTILYTISNAIAIVKLLYNKKTAYLALPFCSYSIKINAKTVC